MGEALIKIANLDQSQLLDTECPQEDSFHQHYITSLKVDEAEAWNLKKLTIGRVEEKNSNKIRDVFPPKNKK